MTQAADFVATAIKEIGTIEVPNNKTKYGKFTGHDGQPWCGSFVMWCASQIGFKDMPNCVYTPTGVQAFKSKSQWTDHNVAKPQPGDVVFFSFSGNGIEHVGIVVKDNGDGTVTTVEGNTSPMTKPKGSQANGGEVAEKIQAYKTNNTRHMAVFIVGFGHPKWIN